jgi:phosphatidylserine decarboxylase
VVCMFDAQSGPFVMVLVGALFVGSMSTIWHGDITPWHGRGIHRLEPTTGAELWQPRGAELGRFNMGSTILMLLPAAMGHWDRDLSAGLTTVVGQGLGTLT